MSALADFARRVAPAATASWVERAVTIIRQFGPYAAVELILPGGSIVVLLLWLFRRRLNLEIGRQVSKQHV